MSEASIIFESYEIKQLKGYGKDYGQVDNEIENDYTNHTPAHEVLIVYWGHPLGESHHMYSAYHYCELVEELNPIFEPSGEWFT